MFSNCSFNSVARPKWFRSIHATAKFQLKKQTSMGRNIKFWANSETSEMIHSPIAKT